MPGLHPRVDDRVAQLFARALDEDRERRASVHFVEPRSAPAGRELAPPTSARETSPNHPVGTMHVTTHATIVSPPARNADGGDSTKEGTIPSLVATSTFVWVIVGIAGVILFALWVLCLFDVLARPNRGAGSKLIWSLALCLLAPFAVVAYLLFGRRP
jgi:hypothetical protein